jgi:hypothetical protein
MGHLDDQHDISNVIALLRSPAPKIQKILKSFLVCIDRQNQQAK